MKKLDIKINVTKRLRTENGLKEFHYHLTFAGGESIGITGPSGAGKTNLLKMMAGLTTPDKGVITVQNTCWFSKHKRINLSPQKRKCGYLSQNPVIFPFLTLEKNILYAAKDRTKACQYLKILGLEAFKDHLPKNLSGGQIKRAAVAQLLAFEPGILLLDEPFTFLDQQWIEQMGDLLSHYLHDGARTLIIVSHQHEYLACLSDRIISIIPGRIRSVGFPNHFSCRKSAYPALYFSKPAAAQ